MARRTNRTAPKFEDIREKGSVTVTEMGYLHGVTSDVQTQLTALAAKDPVYYVQAAAGTAVNASTTLVTQTAFASSVAASKQYEVMIVAKTTSNVAAGAKVQLVLPAGATLLGTWSITNATDTTYTADGATEVQGATVLNPTFIFTGLLVVSSTAGTIAMQMAQNASYASNTTLDAGSFIKTRLLN